MKKEPIITTFPYRFVLVERGPCGRKITAYGAYNECSLFYSATGLGRGLGEYHSEILTKEQSDKLKIIPDFILLDEEDAL